MGRATLTYEGLDKTANCAAHAILRDYGPAADPVLALFDNSPSLFISLMGIFKAGKIYVPVEPSDPLTRLSSIVRNSHARLILTDTAHLPVALKLADSGIEILNVDELPSDLPDERLTSVRLRMLWHVFSIPPVPPENPRALCRLTAMFSMPTCDISRPSA
jgi:non-ribosomal peptide synthetase component F